MDTDFVIPPHGPYFTLFRVPKPKGKKNGPIPNDSRSVVAPTVYSCNKKTLAHNSDPKMRPPPAGYSLVTTPTTDTVSLT